MADPLDALPYELWIRCMALAIDGQQASPLEVLNVSRRWDALVLDTPSLWSQIYHQNGEDEIARISLFLHLSKGCSLHVDIMTALPTVDGLQPIADHISRVTTVSIRPATSNTMTALHMERWKEVASYILARLTNGLLTSDVEYAYCFGFHLREENRLYYCIVLLQFTMVTTGNSTTSAELPVTAYTQMWEEYITRTIRISADQDANARTASVYSLAKLASRAQLHGAVGVAIPSCVKLLKDEDYSIRLAAIDVLHQFAAHVQLHEALELATLALIELLKDKNMDVVLTAVSLLEKLTERTLGRCARGTLPVVPVLIVPRPPVNKCGHEEELHEVLVLVIPSLIILLDRWDSSVRSATVSLLEKLDKHLKLREAMGFAIPSLIKLLEHETAGVRFSAAYLLRMLAEHDELHEAMKLAIPSLFALLEHNTSGVVMVTVPLLKKLAEHGEHREAMALAVPSLTKLLHHNNPEIQSATAFLLEKLAKYDKRHSAAARLGEPEFSRAPVERHSTGESIEGLDSAQNIGTSRPAFVSAPVDLSRRQPYSRQRVKTGWAGLLLSLGS